MSLSNDEIRSILSERGLRATAPRVAVYAALATSARPLSYSEVLDMLGPIDCDPATIYRNLIKLKDSGLAPVVSRIDGIDRYAVATEQEVEHKHPHFSCDDCGLLTCLPREIMNATILEGPWDKAIQEASIQLHGQCPNCS